MFFFLRAQTCDKRLRECGCVSMYTRSSLFPKVLLPDSIKKWQGSFFYVQNLTAANRIGLPCFVNMLSADKAWSQKAPISAALETAVTTRVKDLIAAGLTSRDLTLAWLSRRVFPLQARGHKMCFYSGVRDPTRACAEVLDATELRRQAAVVITDVIKQKWWFGVESFSRARCAPVVSFSRYFSS